MRVFDFDDVGAEVVEEHGGDCAREEAGGVEDAGVGGGAQGWSLARVGVAWQSRHDVNCI